MTTTDDLLNNNANYASAFDKGGLSAPPARQVAVVACMDARLDVYRLLGLSEGDAHVIRNAGGAVTDDAIRSLMISQLLLGTREVVIVQHTDCGMMTFRDDDIKDRIEADTGLRPAFALEAFLRPRAEPPPVHRPHPGQPFHPREGQRPRLRLRRSHRPPQRGLAPRHRPTHPRPSPHRRPPRLAPAAQLM